MTATLLRSTVSLAIAATATLLVVTASAAPASAAAVQAGTAPTAMVNVSGIDLTSPAGVARVEAEVRRAARRVCPADDRSLQAQSHARECTRTAIAAAMPQLEQLAANARDARTALADAPQPTAPVRR
ncbi:MAG: UrcA family protein [Sandarakinorhabdus sp.]|nr:UrcA family protein [Sandarakinorhabdus sp.]